MAMSESGVYELIYWPGIPGRGEFVRLALEDAGVPYLEVCRRSESEGGGVAAIERLLDGAGPGMLPFAPPILRWNELVICQTANILQWLAPRLGLIADDEATRLAANQLQLTIADFVAEAHDVHHPIAASLYYEDQKPEAKRRAIPFTGERMPRFLGYFERVLARAGGPPHAVGSGFSYVDLSLFQLVAGLDYAFPNTLAGLRPELPLLTRLHQAVAARPRIAAYLASPRRLPFNKHGVFRHYPELDEK
jgi:glutathione S-transferase